MSNISVPDILSFSRLSNNVAELKSRVDQARQETVTGRYEDLTAKLKGDVGGAHLLKKAIDDVEVYQENLALAASRAEVTQATLGNIGNESSRIATELQAAVGRGDKSSIQVLVNDATAALTSAFASLNAVFAGRALFSGDATDRPPLAAPEQLIADIQAIVTGATDAADVEAQMDFYFNDPAGGFATSIYQGGVNRAPGVEIASGARIDVSAKADDPALKEIIRGLVTITTHKGATFSDTTPLLISGANQIYDAEALLVDQRAGIGVNEARIGAAKARYEAEEVVLSNLYNEKTLRDPYEAASALQLLESQLEASYLLTARMARLSITDFLR